MTNKPFPFSVCKQCCSGDVPPEQIEKIVEEYLENNPFETIQEITEEEADNIYDGGIYKIKHTRSISGSGGIIRYELLLSSFTAIASGIQMRINSNGIFYRVCINDKANATITWENEWKEYGGSVDLSNYYTKAETNELVNSTAVANETILYEGVVNTPEWTNQPTYEGALDASFNTSDYYYVTLKDANGFALPSDQFMLKSYFGTDATLYGTVFTLADLNTGTGTSTQILAENHPVEFTEIGTFVKMRDAGVTSISNKIDSWNLEDGTGKLKITVHGEWVQKAATGYFYPYFATSKNVESYHSSSTKDIQSAATKQILPYIQMGGEYPNNRVFDDCIIERNGNGYFSLKRFTAIKHSAASVFYKDCVGYGNISAANTDVTSVVYRVNNSANGVFRNGTYLRITEVK